jgi:hypothetical protein
VKVEYLDERKFATLAANKAKAGAQIVDLTYREKYVGDPAGQWQGYTDTDSERAWGVSEWAQRAASSAYFDWLTGNAILPSEDPDPAHTGLDKIGGRGRWPDPKGRQWAQSVGTGRGRRALRHRSGRGFGR